MTKGTEKAGFKIDVWWGAWSSKSSAQMRKGISDQAAELGHKLKFHVIPRHGAPSSRWLKPTKGCDGHVVMLTEACAFHETAGAAGVPRVYLWMTNASSDEYQPLVQLDMNDALTRAINRLAEPGCERIGLLGYNQAEYSHRPIYDQTMRTLGLDYRAVEFCNANEEAVSMAVSRLFGRPDPPQALYVNDDVVMKCFIPLMKSMGLVPGKNIGIITHSNRFSHLPGGYRWSCMEFDPYMIGRLSTQCLVRSIESNGDEMLSFSQQAIWRQGETHVIS